MTDTPVRAPMACTVVAVMVAAGDAVTTGQPLLIVEAMKMEHELCADAAGRVLQVVVRPGDAVAEGEVLMRLGAALAASPRGAEAAAALAPAPRLDPAAGAAAPPLRADLRAVHERHALTLDAQRPAAVARRHALGLRTARENLADLCDDGSFIEYGALAFAAQRARRSLDDLIANTPADGLITGLAGINGTLFGAERARCAVLAYDATVLAGTQGLRNHQKLDRLLGIAQDQRLPLVLFGEGGGGRPGDTDLAVVAGLHLTSFAAFARLAGRVPVIGIVAGRSFAGNAALIGCCDVIVATRTSNLGMAGPAMVEGGGLGVFVPEQIGPAAVQATNGVVDVLVDNEAAAVAVAKQYLAFFQGRTTGWSAPDAASLREALPANRVRAYDVRAVLRGLVDTGSLLELQAGHGGAVLTALARIEGRPVGVLASDPAQRGGAIDAAAATKAARFIRHCDAHGLALVSLIDTPGFMVGPDAEAEGQVRCAGDLFIAAARRRVPLFAIVLRKAYGLGAMALAGGGLHAPLFTVAWPSGEFGAMGLEGAVRLGYRKELDALPEGAEREALFEHHLEAQVAAGQAINVAAMLEIDAVIDPAQTRRWLVLGLAGTSRSAVPAGE